MSRKILIIEDDPVLQEVFQIILKTGGYDISVANNGIQGLEKLKSFKPGLILLDIFMPIMDGREFLRNMNTDDYPDTKIIVYSNLSDQNTESEMKELGAHDFILKSSMTPKDLLALAERHLTT